MIESQDILIIGANSRVALELVRRLARNNRLYLLARNAGKLKQNLSALNIAPSWSASVDCLDTEQTRVLIEKAWRESGGIDLAIIAYGILGEQIATEHNYLLAEEVINTNFTCVVSQLISLSNLMEARGSGKIAVITSVAGDRGRPRNYTYGAAKGALGLYLQGLRSKLWGGGVEIYDLRMGPVDTPMTATHTKDFSFAKPEQVATTMVKILDSKKYTAYIPGFWRPVMWAVRNMPEAVFQRLKFLSGR